MKDRVIERMENIVADEGFTNEKVYAGCKHGPADFSSYFDYLVDRKLAGEEVLEPTPEELWNAMKKQLNFSQAQSAKASTDYSKLENQLRDANNLIGDLMREME